MSENTVEKLFKTYRKQYVKKYGKIPLDNVQIDKECSKRFGTRYRGCYAQDERFPITNGFYLINTDTQSGPGIHWCSIVITPKRCYIYDSFCRNPNNLLKHLTKRMKSRQVIYDIHDKEQKDEEVVCGHNCLAFLRVAKELGIRQAIKI